MFKRSRTPEIPAYGDAHFATRAEMEKAGLLGPIGIPLGYYREPGSRNGWGQKIRYSGDAGLMLVAPTRSGKSRDVLVEALLEYDQSVIVIDPKGELAAVTKAKRERMGQRVITLNPFELWPEILGPSACYNPMDLLDPDSPEFDAERRKLAEGLIARDHDKASSHWVGGARGLPTGIIGGLVAHGAADTRNLGYVREVICDDGLLLRYARASLKSEHAFVRQEMKTYSVAEPHNAGEIASFRQTAHEQTFFLGMKQMVANLSRSDFRFADMKERPTTVYIILPDNRLDVCGRWFRLIVASALDDLWRGGKGKYRVLLMLDEMSQIGHLDVLENAAAAAAGRGVQIWPILQNLGQLKKDYGESFETFLSAADMRMFMAPRDQATAEYVSKQVGQRTVTTAGQSIRNDGLLTRQNESDSSGQAGQPLIRPHEISSFGMNEALIVGPQNIVIDTLRRPYFHTPELQFAYEQNPMQEVGTDPPPPTAPETITTFADMLAASDARAERGRRARRPIAVRLLIWGHSGNPYLNALLKIEYFVTLPLRLLLALMLAPFAIHNRPLGAAVGFLALFGFWEVWAGFAKKPFLNFYESQRINCAMRKSNELGIGGVDGHPFACETEALRLTTSFFWKRVFVATVTEGPVKMAHNFDVAYQKARFADRAGLPVESEAPSSETPLDIEARNKAAAFWSTLLTTCGGSSYFIERGYQGLTAVTEMKGAVSFFLRAEELSGTERVKGTEWRGHSIMVGPNVSRIRNFVEQPIERNPLPSQANIIAATLGPWGAWRDGGSLSLSLSLERRSGKWSFHLMGDHLETDRFVRRRLSCGAMTGEKAGNVTLSGDFVSGEQIFIDLPSLLAKERTPWAQVPIGEKLGEARTVETTVTFEEIEHPAVDVDRLKRGVEVFPDDGTDFLQKPNYVLTRRAETLYPPQEIRLLLTRDGSALRAAMIHQKPTYDVVVTNEGYVGLILQEDYSASTRPAPWYLP